MLMSSERSESRHPKNQMKHTDIHTFVTEQLTTWPLAAENFAALADVHVREIEVNGLTVRLQFNPARMISSAARLTKEDIARRKCFLCEQNRPPVQKNIPFTTTQDHEYHILVNPYPIFPDHLVIAKSTHQDQGIAGRYEDMLEFARMHPECTFYYNGPCCGASAPDHHHFQGVPRGVMPLEADVEVVSKTKTENSGAHCHQLLSLTDGVIVPVETLERNHRLQRHTAWQSIRLPMPNTQNFAKQPVIELRAIGKTALSRKAKTNTLY